jgi:hypothetical protein
MSRAISLKALAMLRPRASAMPVVAVLNILLLSSVTGPFFTKTMVATTQAAHNNNDMIHLAKAPIRRCPNCLPELDLNEAVVTVESIERDLWGLSGRNGLLSYAT